MSLLKSNLFKRSSLLTISQILTLGISAILILIIPKFITVDDYGYWQLFILYSGYVGLFHFGFSDGIYITLGGKNIDVLDKKQIKSQFTIFLLFQLIFSVAILLFTFSYFTEINKLFVFGALGIFLFIENYHKLLSFMLLSTSESNTYAKSVIIDKTLTVFLLIIVFITNKLNFISLLYVYVLCRFISLVYLVILYRDFVPIFLKKEEFKNVFSQVFANSKLGISLTISTIFGTLIIGSGRLVVEQSWSIASFAQISLAVSLSFFILSFISQISLILFPILCNAAVTLQKKILQNGSILLGYIAMICFSSYFLIYLFINYWLVEYKESLSYLIYLFPMVLFEMKTQVLYITYCKSNNKLKLLLHINLIVMIVALILYYIAAKIHSIELVLITMFFALMLRSILLRLFLNKFYELKFDRYFYIEIIFSLSFIVVNKFFGIYTLLIYFLLSITIITLLSAKDLKLLYLNFKNRNVHI